MNEIKTVLKRSWQSHFWTNVATLTVLTLSFSLVFGVLLGTKNLSQILTVWGEEIQLTVYLKDGISQEQKGFLDTLLHSEPGLQKLDFVDKDKAYHSFEKSLSSYGPKFMESIGSAGENPFPASYIVKLEKSSATPEKIEILAKKIQKIEGVEDVNYGQEWVSNYATLLKVSRTMALLIAVIIFTGCIFTISNSIQASLFSRREEIEILELVGATSKKIRTPFLIEGAFQGFLASTLSLILLGISYKLMINAMENILGAGSLISAMSFLSIPLILTLLAGGIALGAFGSYICVARLNTGWAGRQGING